MRLVEVKRNRFVVYDDNGKVVIITCDSRIAKGFMDDRVRKARQRQERTD